MTARIIQAVLFDLGGTLMYSREPWEPILERGYRAMAESFYAQGLDIDSHDLPRTIRYHLDQYFARRDQDLYETTYVAVLRDLLRDKGHPHVHVAVIRRALDAFYVHTQANWTLEEDALLTLRTLEAGGYHLGLVSNAGDNQDVFQLVDRFKIEPYFDFVLTSAACSYRKPHARIFELALAHWHIPAHEIAMVGDSLEADIAGAGAMGLYTAWISRRAPRTAARSTVRPDAELRSLIELPALLSRLAT